MHVTPFFIWCVSLLLTALGVLFLPALRTLLYFMAAAHIPVFALGIQNIRLRFFGNVYIRDQSGTNTIALTFDDGPDPDITPDILDLLRSHNMTATFFVIGTRAQKHPGIVKQCFESGHTIACHDLSHSVFSNFRITTPMVRDISKAQSIIQSIIGKKPLLYRPPVGLMNPHTLKALKKLNMYCIGWSKSSGDGGNRYTKGIKRIHTLAGRGEVVLLHDTIPKPSYKKIILEKIDQLCIAIKKRNLTTVSIADMFHIPAYE